VFDKRMVSGKSFQQFQLPRAAVVLLLLIVLAIGAVPSYFSGHWSWAHPPKISAYKQLRSLPKTGLAVPGWQTLEREVIPIGGHKWVVQTLRQQSSPASSTPTSPQAILLLLPQASESNQPEVEWMDINGLQRWQTDSVQQIKFSTVQENSASSTPPAEVQNQVQSPVTVTARFLRGWKLEQTYAALQWYAWPQGGSFAPSHWFWADRLAQWQRARQPWVAVCILIPIEPLGDIASVEPLATALGQAVQTALLNGPLTPSAPK
jgi:cyanoexosortase B-associated protein